MRLRTIDAQHPRRLGRNALAASRRSSSMRALRLRGSASNWSAHAGRVEDARRAVLGPSARAHRRGCRFTWATSEYRSTNCSGFQSLSTSPFFARSFIEASPCAAGLDIASWIEAAAGPDGASIDARRRLGPTSPAWCPSNPLAQVDAQQPPNEEGGSPGECSDEEQPEAAEEGILPAEEAQGGSHPEEAEGR